MTDRDYVVGGCTALIDAIGGAIHHIGKLHKYFGESAPEHTMFVITTDGQENASHRYTIEMEYRQKIFQIFLSEMTLRRVKHIRVDI